MMSRREFLRAASWSAAGAALAGPHSANASGGEARKAFRTPQSTRKGDMLYRTLGRTGETVSVIGLGGAHIGQPEEKESIRLIRTAVDRGITFMDNSWDYNNGKSETYMGKGLRDGYREKVFLMTKIDGRDAKTAAKQIDESLKRLQTDHVDLLQFHELIRMDDADTIFAEGGALEAVRKAKQAGKLRYIGFTGHKDPAIHLRTLDVARRHGFRFDTVQMPLNVMDAHFRSFQHQVLPELLAQEIGVLGMKSMGDKFILESKTVSATECLHYAMTLPTSVVITGIEKMEILEQALEAAKTFAPLTETQIAELLARTRDAAAQGRYERFKTTAVFDSTAQHPEWLGNRDLAP